MNNDSYKKEVWFEIADLFLAIGDYEKGLEYYRMLNVPAWVYAGIFIKLKQYDSAKYYFSLRVIDTSDTRELRRYLSSTGDWYFSQNQYSEALPYFTRALSYHRQSNDINPVMETLRDIAKTYLAMWYYDSAFTYARETYSIAKQKGAKQFVRDASEILAEVYEHWNRPDSAYFYYKQYTTIKDSIQNNVLKGKLAAYDFDRKMELVNKEKQIQQVQLQKQSILRNILIAGIIILLLLSVIIFRAIVLKRKNEKQRLEHQLELQQLESKIKSQQALLNERLRISRELHDDIGSTLGSISIYSEVAKKRTEKNENTNEVLSKIGLASRELIDKMSDIVWSLNPNNESFEQLQNRMMTFAAMILAPRNILYEFTVDEGLKEIQFTGEQRKNIFLIFKEALHNIVKYADCKTAHITLSLKNNNLVMTVRDDGKGFDVSQITANEIFPIGDYLGGNGIKNMHSRADDLNATLCIHSTVNEGTTVQLVLDL
jgi:signal transduction histidine kinase